MTTKGQKTKSPTSFIEEADRLYQKNPLAAAVNLFDGIREFGNDHLEATQSWDAMKEYAEKTGSWNLETGYWSLMTMAQDAERGRSTSPEEWKEQVQIAQTVARMIEEAHD